MGIRGVVPKLTLGALGGPQNVLSGLHVTGGATEVSAAAWLVWGRRRAFHKKGVVDFDIPEKAALPRWFSAAIDVLRSRPESWNVITLSRAGRVTCYRVAWLDWRAQRSRGKS